MEDNGKSIGIIGGMILFATVGAGLSFGWQAGKAAYNVVENKVNNVINRFKDKKKEEPENAVVTD